MIRVRAIDINDSEKATKEISAIGPDEFGLKWMKPKAVHRTLKIEGIRTAVANIIKQEMLSKGGEVVLPRQAGNNTVDTCDILLMGTVRQFADLTAKLKMQPFGMAQLAEEISVVLKNLEGHGRKFLRCREHTLPLGEKTLVMGILNVTPDSFSDGGKFFELDKAIEHAKEMVEQGADIIDIGGESTRPNYDPVGAEEELERVIPVLERLVKEVPVPISVDTYKSQVARRALEVGAHILNDVWGLQADPDLAKVAAEYDVPLILMHNQRGTEYKSMMDDILASLRQSIQLALDAGVKEENIIIDPGIGFGKDTDQNLEVMNRLWEFKTLGYPVLLGTSRKSMIGNTLGLPVTERVEGTAATVAFGIAQGVDIVRIHDVKEMVRVARMTDAMVRR
ncbi:dihydropteroate synthase [Thermincola potens]|uniref:Dihydropteroate synthase n=1 Tax=Thermincola potens (strain JR) TaxID=635013 RepID=D5X9M7_THEPJ|nr:dihydropteroate synthase [Thermincola potens]ADG81098.1 dihydropteroate synthase [Thermincola potens JR]